MRFIALSAALLGGVVACGELPTTPVPLRASAASTSAAPNYIPGRYIVRFRGGASPDVMSNAIAVGMSHGGVIDRVYTSAINGAAMQLSDVAAAALRADPRVLSVEQDQVISKHTVQANPTWGLDRIDQRLRPLSASYTYSATGSGVTVYILDSGINYAQADFGGRAIPGIDAITAGGNASDCDGHGTHVAGTVGSSTYGVAKNVRLVSVRVLDCAGNGTLSSVLAGVDWVSNNRVLPAVANMSLGGGTNATLNLAVEASIATGVTYVVSAGNNAADACTQSPASAASVLAVGATDVGDVFSWYSNFGSCVDLLAPGSDITSWWLGGGANTISGTSMASPHVAGAAALYLQGNPGALPAQVRTVLLGNATASAVSGLPAATPNLLLYVGSAGAPAAPVAAFTYSCSANTCTFDGSPSTSDWPTPAYLWNFGDATSSTLKSPVHTFPQANTYTVSLTVTDPNGTSTSTQSVVLNRPPVATITAPAPGVGFSQGAPVTFAGTGSDPEDGALSGASLTWTSSLDGAIGTGTSFTSSTLSAGAHVITLTARDSRNVTGTATRSITVGAAGNQPPVARFTWSCPSLTCTMNASASTDDAGIIKFVWFWGDTTPASSSSCGSGVMDGSRRRVRARSSTTRGRPRGSIRCGSWQSMPRASATR
jgi:subtilisin family serine protease